ncbi:hypothetical protein ANCCAN_15183 [Ancylostoma caninum]|uniref:Uncharacterized protein n=1 Tax=Ancylostoma caninum TaxID=29170 RepID=A0A368G6G9_ANCCA|nr:hypothetical protein ANCCAN_15183 [Ancylostoma caninum]
MGEAIGVANSLSRRVAEMERRLAEMAGAPAKQKEEEAPVLAKTDLTAIMSPTQRSSELSPVDRGTKGCPSQYAIELTGRGAGTPPVSPAANGTAIA